MIAPMPVIVTSLAGLFGSVGGKLPQFEFCLKSAVRFSGCPVFWITNYPEDAPSFGSKRLDFIELAENHGIYGYLKERSAHGPIPLGPRGLRHLNILSLVRWVAIREAIARGIVALPIMTIDWDLLLMSSMPETFPEQMLKMDVTCAQMNYPGACQAPFTINTLRPLDRFLEKSQEYLSRETFQNDMVVWTEIYRDGTQVGDIGAPISGGIFDGNISCSYGLFKTEITNRYNFPTKIIEWREGIPFFVTTEGSLVRAHAIHCWLPYKHRMEELYNKRLAALPESSTQ